MFVAVNVIAIIIVWCVVDVVFAFASETSSEPIYVRLIFPFFVFRITITIITILVIIPVSVLKVLSSFLQ